MLQEFKIFLKPLINILLLISSIFLNLIILFGYSLIVIVSCSILVTFYLGLCFFLPHLTPPLGTSTLLIMAFIVPRSIFVFIKHIAQLTVKFKNIAFFLFILGTLLVMAGIEKNPGPNSNKKLSFAIWNLDSLPAREYARIPLIESFQAEQKLDFFGICETSLTGNISNEDIFIEGFSPDPIRADKTDGTRNGGVCLYFRENLPIKPRPDLVNIPETIVAEIKLNRKKIFLVLSYRHPNTPIDEFKDYVKSLENIYENINRENPSMTVICGDFNARSPLFWENDAASKEGEIFSNFLISNNMEELINEPTHIRQRFSVLY